ncbi:hypothetical protein WGT02_03785 [Rhizobium sp. T1470]|uniref:hypothetical protein n=1 Tax=unclassified Rhizobium TaxID=2613769 RepID=UPI001AAEEB1B|nr:hypothetical protein [Rhizobium sp. T1473]MCA0800442.1 hypothetical protein [Rhizobium sp. T1473]
MFSDNKNDKVAYFGVWADAAGDYRLRREALRLCIEAACRCFDQDMRASKDTQAALSYLGESIARAGVLSFRKALELPDPYEREQAAQQACASIARCVLGRPLSEGDWK